MRRGVILGVVLAATACAAAVWHLWPTTTQQQESPKAPIGELEVARTPLPTPTPSVTTAPPELSAQVSPPESYSDEWDVVLATLREGKFDQIPGTAERLKPLSQVRQRQLLDLMLGLDIGPSRRKLAKTACEWLLLPLADEATLTALRGECWESLGRAWGTWPNLAAGRATLYAERVTGKPIAVPERAALTSSDDLVVEIALFAGVGSAEFGTEPSMAAAEELAKLAVLESLASRPFLEPALSGAIRVLRVDRTAGLEPFLERLAASAALSDRLRWECRPPEAGSSPTLEAIRQIEAASQREGSRPERILQEWFKSGPSRQEVFGELVPALISILGVDRTRSVLGSSLLTASQLLEPDVRRRMAQEAADELIQNPHDTGVGAAAVAMLRPLLFSRIVVTNRPPGTPREYPVPEHRFLGDDRLRQLDVSLRSRWKCRPDPSKAYLEVSETMRASVMAANDDAEALTSLEKIGAGCRTELEGASFDHALTDALELLRVRFGTTRDRAYQVQKLAASSVARSHGKLSKRPVPAQSSDYAGLLRLIDLALIWGEDQLIALDREPALAVLARFEELCTVVDAKGTRAVNARNTHQTKGYERVVRVLRG